MARRRLLALLGLLGLGCLAAGGFAWADGGQLHGSVGPSFVISLQDAAGANVTHLDPGTFQLQVDDLSDEHNFRLQGPGGVDVGTDVEGQGTKTFSVSLVDGVYSYLCEAHPTRMHGQFTVGTASIPPPPPPPTPTPRLALTVTGKAITLRKSGVAVRRLAAGSYVVKVVDRSKTQNAHLLGAGVNRRTGITFVGASTWKITLTVGMLVFRSDVTKPKLRAGRVAVS